VLSKSFHEIDAGGWDLNPTNQHAMEINGGFVEGIDRLKGSMQADRRQSTLP